MIFSHATTQLLGEKALVVPDGFYVVAHAGGDCHGFQAEKCWGTMAERHIGAPFLFHVTETGEEFTEENEPPDLPLIVLRGTCMWEGQKVFKTALA